MELIMTIVNLPVKSPQEASLLLSALKREQKLIQWKIQKTQSRLEEFEKKHNMSSGVFFKKYEKGELGDDEPILTWAGEYQLFLRYQTKLSHLEELIAECQRLF
jgi:hypothetical protein